MTDRELLLNAAKAAGMRGTEIEHMLGGGLCLMSPDAQLGMWAPLTDDGDALRLAVKLGIQIGDFTQYGRALAFHGATRGAGEFWETEGDPYAATRRAIVRAAAAMVKP